MHLFFDLDNTLWDFDLNSYNVLNTLFSDLNLEHKLHVKFDAFFSFYKKKNDELWYLYYKKQIQKSELRYKRFYDSLLHFGSNDLELSKLLSEEYVRISPYSKALKPGAIETLETLSKHHSLHIITNGFKEVQNIKIDNCGLRNYFQEIIISEEHGYTKPHIEIFRLAENRADADKSECVMIGDNWISDIEGAIGAGWKAVFYKMNEKALFAHKNLQEIAHLNELQELF
ncbi:MAG: YjjG family noncanonical pyrimidine nucleotidase [Bacteroidia bacterium]|nr:YjjG family noncanonical pyrimidine nucleotidase [Bacteroidia bacterium]